jgi:hypothetical protein
MLFKAELARKIFDGQKTETRRIKKGGEYQVSTITRDNFGGKHVDYPYHAIYGNRLKWGLDREYGVQIKRGGHSIGKIRVTGLYDQCIRDINTDNSIAEGFASKEEFVETWQKIYGKKSLNADV